MKKISSKIIVSFLLAIFLFGGIGFGVGELQAETNNTPIGISAPINNGVVSNNSTATYGDTSSPAAEEKAMTFWDILWAGGEGIKNVTLGIISSFLQLGIIPVLGVITKLFAFFIDQGLQYTLNTTNITSANEAIVFTWSIIRNVFNITFIFILLYASIKMILGTAGSDTKKIIASVITSALLINFSLFITRILIDAGNILAVSIYNIIISSPGTISAQIANTFNIGAFFASTKVSCTFCTPYFIVTVLQIIGMILAIITFGYIASLLLVRNVALIFLMALSPIGFMGKAIPKLEEYSKMWWENLYGQIFVAPIFLLLLMLILKIASIFNKGIDEAQALTDAEKLTANDASFLPYFKFLMVIILIIIAAKVTKKMSGVVGEMAGKVGSLAVGAALGAATGGAAFAMRATLGRGANALANNQTLKNASVGDNMLGRGVSKMLLSTGGFVSKRSFDLRGVSAISDNIKKATGVDIKEGAFGTKFGSLGKGGYAGRIKEQEKKAEERAEKLTKGISVSDSEINDAVTEKRSKLAELRTERDRLKSLATRTDDENAKLKDYEATIKSFAGLDGEKFKKKVRGEVEEKKKEQRLEAAAKLAEGITWDRTMKGKGPGKILNSVLGGSKEKAKKLRDAYKKKDSKTEIWEAVKRASEEAAEPEAKSAASGSTPPPTS
jgi:hypothetical protein